MTDNFIQYVVLGTEEKYFVFFLVRELNEIVHEVDPGNSLNNRLSKKSWRPHNTLAVGINNVCINHALLQLSIPMHEYDLACVHYGMANSLIFLNSILNEVQCLLHRHVVDGCSEDINSGL